MECQVDKNEHFRHHLLFAFNRGAKATEAAREICAVYGKGAIAERTAQYWFAKFKRGNSYGTLSVYGTNLSSSFRGFGTSVKRKKKVVSKMLVFVDLTLHLNALKINKNESKQKNQIDFLVERKILFRITQNIILKNFISIVNFLI